MKTVLTFAGTAMVLAFLSVACSNPADGTGNLPRLSTLEGTVSIYGIAMYGETLTAIPINISNPGDLTFQWRRIYANGRTTNIGAGSTYILRLADRGNLITVVAFRHGYSNAIRSEPIKILPYQQTPGGDLFISFACFRDDTIDQIYMYIYFDGPSRKITLLEPEQYAGSIEWWLGRFAERSLGVDDGVTGYHNEILVVSAELLEYGVGAHFLTIKVRRNGVSYSKLIELGFRL